MNTLFLRLPSKAVADSLPPGTPLVCPYAATEGNAIEREGVATLSELGDIIPRVRRVVVLLAASDVTLLRVKVPPLSAARLKAALPNLVEDQLMSDPEDCVVVAGQAVGDTRTVGVVQRDWLELLSRTLLSLGARSITAIPAQLCLPSQDDAVLGAVSEHGTDIDVALRLSEQDGMGLSIVADQPETAAFEVMQSLHAVVPQGNIVLYVPQARVRDYQDSLHVAPALEERVALHADNWPRWIAGAQQSGLDLMSGLGMAAAPRFDWKPWRWTIILAVAVLLVNALALNIDWLRARREADTLRSAMFQTYKNAYPKETVIVDPLAQLRQKIAAAQRESGQLAPDDFISLAAAFSDAWTAAGVGAPAIAGLEYHDRALLVKLKPNTPVTMDQLRNALTARNLSVASGPNGAWQVRSVK
ncbi:general secretion pathway protein GspL [Oxalobacteraceae bacterium OM1]|nr:general secretion pathway protein GspL [Oxalobacteraceae bacterium OM1]